MSTDICTISLMPDKRTDKVAFHGPGRTRFVNFGGVQGSIGKVSYLDPPPKHPEAPVGNRISVYSLFKLIFDIKFQ